VLTVSDKQRTYKAVYQNISKN